MLLLLQVENIGNIRRRAVAAAARRPERSANKTEIIATALEPLAVHKEIVCYLFTRKILSVMFP